MTTTREGGGLGIEWRMWRICRRRKPFRPFRFYLAFRLQIPLLELFFHFNRNVVPTLGEPIQTSGGACTDSKRVLARNFWRPTIYWSETEGRRRSLVGCTRPLRFLR